MMELVQNGGAVSIIKKFGKKFNKKTGLSKIISPKKQDIVVVTTPKDTIAKNNLTSSLERLCANRNSSSLSSKS